MAVFDEGSCRGITEPIRAASDKDTTHALSLVNSSDRPALGAEPDCIEDFRTGSGVDTLPPRFLRLLNERPNCAFHRYRANLPRSARQPFLRPRVRLNPHGWTLVRPSALGLGKCFSYQAME